MDRSTMASTMEMLDDDTVSVGSAKSRRKRKVRVFFDKVQMSEMISFFIFRPRLTRLMGHVKFATIRDHLQMAAIVLNDMLSTYKL